MAKKVLLGKFRENLTVSPVNELGTNETYVKRFRLYGMRTTFKFNRPAAGVEEIDWLRKGFRHIVDKMKVGTEETDQLGFTLKSLNLKHKEPGYISFRPASEVSADLMWEIFGGIIQSNTDSITSSDTFEIHCTRISLPVGSGGRKRGGLYNSFEEESKARRGIVVIKNKDQLCLPRAIVVAKANVKAKQDSSRQSIYKAIRQDKGNKQTLRAKKLMSKARVQIPEEGAGIPELERFQAHLKKYNIVVYNYNSKGRDVYYSGDNKEAQFNLNLLFHEGHFNVITSLTAAFVCAYFCEPCRTPFNVKGNHRCDLICQACHTTSPPCKQEYDGVVCPDCNRFFKNQICFIAHQGDVCNRIKKCTDCHKTIRVKERKTRHMCGEVFCSICQDFKESNHQCYMRPDTGTPKSKDFLFIFFDLETRQDDVQHDDPSVNVHKVNLCVMKQYCAKCIDSDACDDCPTRMRIFKDDPIEQFMDYVMTVRKTFKDVCIVAHNSAGFDNQFVYKYLLEKTKFTPKIIQRGTKLILMKIDNVRFVDSLCYFPMALAALPKAFDLPPEKKKGYFPHLFNTIENQNYIGPMPAKEYYCPDSMFEKGKKQFDEWHRDQVVNNYIFDFQKELVEYCISDVDILAQACIKFRSLFLTECNVDPFREATTIASACNLVFRRNYLKENTIGLIPKKGYRLVDNQSSIALQWLSWEEEQRSVRIQHSGREREVTIEGMKVDGFDGERVYEFQGCYFHGCPKCFPYKREEPLQEDPSDSLHSRYERTRRKIEKLTLTEYEIVEMWECGFRKIKREQGLEYLERLSVLNTLPLNPRDSFFGGRTGNTKVYHKCTDDEQIHYMDICSLYPWVCKYGKYPVGHPKIHVGDEECRRLGENVDGLLKCKVLPPTNLYHPVLPMRMHDKLMFLLCRMCGENLVGGECTHSEEERSIVGTWTMDEIRKAKKKGYTIIEMYEIWEYEVATYEKSGLFTDFINKFLKIKQEASGFPSWVRTEEDKDKYIRDYFDKEGILLDKIKICKNEGLRSLAKLMLNSFWGKLGQRENMPKTMVAREPKELFQLLTNPSVQVNCVQEVNDKVVLANWQHLEEVSESLRTVNVVLAAYTTAQARLKLYEHLEQLDRQVLYYDTDSVLYKYKPGMYRIQPGDYLGQMTDELESAYGVGSYISEFVSGGPKTYAYLAHSTKENKIKHVCKIKGLTLNLKTSEQLNFEKLKDMVHFQSEPPLITESRIRRTKEREVVTVKETKLFKITGPKRKREGQFDTLPYGFKKQRF